MQVEIGDIVIYYNEDREPYAALITYVHADMSRHCDLPICNMTIFKPEGRVAAMKLIEPAYHDGIRWHLLNKWAHKGEVPKEECNDPNPRHGRLAFTTIQPSIG